VYRDSFGLGHNYEYVDCPDYHYESGNNPQRDNKPYSEEPIASRFAEHEDGNNAVSNNATNNVIDNLPSTILPLRVEKDCHRCEPQQSKTTT
jgi:hypothetical protein